MKKIYKQAKALAVALLMCGGTAMAVAQTGAPHTVTATANYNAVTLDWEEPASDVKLKWHNEYDYDASDGVTYNPEDMTAFYVSSYFTAADLKNVVGETVEAISYMQYRPVYRVTVQVYENGTLISEGVDDQSNFSKGDEMKVQLATPVVIKAGVDLRFAVKFECGSNMDMVASRDAGPTVVGKGDCLSYDGKNWISTNGGNYWVTAWLKNEATTAPDGYNVYCDGVKVNSELCTDTEYVLTEQSAGAHTYSVSAVYGGEEMKSYEVAAVVNLFPTPVILSAENELFTNTLTWQAPRLDNATLTWSNQEVLNGMGGTGSSPKFWIKQEFEASDLATYVGAEISAINVYCYEKEGTTSSIKSGYLYIIEDDVMVYSEELTSDELSGITFNAWNKFTLDTPYKIEAGKKVAYGVYVTHPKGTYPVAYDTSVIAVDGKGNMYSTSSPNSTTFTKSKPSWKSPLEAGITGNWMLTADVTGANAKTLSGYDVYRNGEKVATGVTATSYQDEVDAPGFYTYGVVAVGSDGATSDASEMIVEVALPDSYRAPFIEEASFDDVARKFAVNWSMDAELKHYGNWVYTTGFTEEMTLMMGTKFTAAELANYKGYTINRIVGALYESVGDVKVGVYNSKGVALGEATVKEGEYEPATTFYATLSTPVAITGEEDLYIAYTLTLPANASPVILDGGPLVENGALVSLTNGVNWLKLGTLIAEANDFNIVISALASAQNATPSSRSEVMVCSGLKNVSTVAPAEIEPASVIAPKAAVTNNPKVAKFNIYCNNEKIAETTEYDYEEVLKRFGPYVYEISAVYDNGWESARSEQLSFTNTIEQKNPAPFDLKGEVSGENLNLSWSDASAAKVLTYETGTADNAMKLSGTGSGFYAAVKYSVEDLADKVGMKVSHVKVKLASDDIYTFSVLVMYGDNIVYEQPVNTSDLVVGYNTIRLDNPVEIPANWEVGVGYFVNGATGVGLLVMDEGPAVEGYGDYYSTSGSSWYSMKKKNKQDYNWRISAVLETADQNVMKPMAVDELTGSYNVYCNGELIAEGVTAEQYTVLNAKEGDYYVTAVTDGVESAESNTVVYTYESGIDDVVAGAVVSYNAATQTIEMSAEGDCNVYAASGVEVKSASGVSSVSLEDLASGVYVATVNVAGEVTTLKIAK